MSNRYYNSVLTATRTNLEDVLNKDQPTIKRDQLKANIQVLIVRYVEYTCIMKNLDACYDQVVHPQKRPVIRKLLDGTLGRILEIRKEIVSMQLCEYICFDQVLSDLRLTHDDIALTVPKYFLQSRKKELIERSNTMNDILEKFGLSDDNSKERSLDLEEAVLLLQRMERARQGRMKARCMEETHLKQLREKVPGPGSSLRMLKAHSVDEQEKSEEFAAAMKIQQIWKGYSVSRKVKRQNDEEMKFLGLKPAPICSHANSQYSRAEEIVQQRRSLQAKLQSDYEIKMKSTKDEVAQNEGFNITEGLQAEVRNWFFAYKEKLGRFPDYPSDEEGGYQPEKLVVKEEENETKKTKKTVKQQVQSGKGVKKTMSSDSDSSSLSGPITSPTFQESFFLQNLISSNDECKELLGPKENSMNGLEIIYDETALRLAKRQEVAKELRAQVDALMRKELEHLKIAMLLDQGKKGKKLKAALKSKNAKKQKVKKKKRKDRDLTAHRDNEQLYEELVREGIIRDYPKVHLDDFIGEPTYISPNLEKNNVITPRLALADVKRLVTEYCILPLGSSVVHQNAPLTRSVLLTGPAGSGKTMLANMTCTETGATLFDLSASNIAGKYPGRDGLKMLLHLVSKVGRLLQPSVILIEDADKMYIKKPLKAEKVDPKRLKKGLQKIVKSIGPDDRILVLGTSRSPFETDMKSLVATFNKIIVISRPDHASRFALWNEMLKRMGGWFTNAMDMSTLAKISDGYTPGNIVHAIHQVLTPHRVALQRRKQLHVKEFVGALSKYEPVYKEEEDAFQAWQLRTPLAKLRITSLEPHDNKRKSGLKKKKK